MALNDTINVWDGDGVTTAFTFSFTNYNSDYHTLEGYVRDKLTYAVDQSYGWSFDVSGTEVLLNKALATGKQFVLEIKLNKTPEVFYQDATETMNDISLNKNVLQAIALSEAALDHRTNPRHSNEDMNNKKIVNLAPGVNPNDAVTMQQLSDGVGNIDVLVQRAETAADEAELAQTAAGQSATAAMVNAQAAEASAQESAASAAVANTMYKGEWEIDYPSGADTGYLIGDTVLYQNNQYKSIVNNNTSVPTSTLGTEWLFYLPGAISSAAQAASFFQTYLQGDGVTTDFDLTAINPTWTPKIDNNIFLVLINNETELDWTLTVDSDGHSILSFVNAPAESNDTNKNNIFVVGGSPIISDIPREPKTSLFVNENGIIENRQDIGLPINDTIYYAGEYDARKRVDNVYNNAPYDYSDYSFTTTDNTSTSINQSISYNISEYAYDDVLIDSCFEMFSLPTSVDGFGVMSNQTNQVAPFLIRLLPDGTLRLWLSSNNSSFDIAENEAGTKVFSINTKYIVRLFKDTPNSQWLVQWSDDDGQTFNTDITINSALKIANSTSSTLNFGYEPWLKRELTGKLYLDGIQVIINNETIVRRQDVPYILNTVAWKGKARSDDNTSNIISNDYVYSEPIFNANSQYSIYGSGIDTYDYTDFTFNPDGTLNTNPYVSASGYSASDFDARIKFEFSNSNNTKPIISLGNGPGNLGIVAKTNASGLMELFISSNSTTWDISNGLTGTKVYNIDTVYVVRVHRDTSNWYLDWSDDNGQTWTNDITANSSLDMFEQTLNFSLGGDYTPGTDIFMTGKIYLDGTSLFLNGEYVLATQDQSTSTLPNTDYYLFVGYDNSNNLKLERTVNKDGTGLPTITGAKRRIGDDKDVSFPTDGNGDLAYFERNFNTWEFDLWNGSFTTGTITLNNSILNYTNIIPIFTYAGSYRLSEIINSRYLDEYATSSTLVYDLRKSTAGADYLFRFYLTNPNTLVCQFNQGMTLFRIKGIK